MGSEMCIRDSSPGARLYKGPLPDVRSGRRRRTGARRRPPDGEISRRTGPDGGPTLAWTPLDRCRTGRRTADLVPDGAGRSRTAPDGAGPEPDAGRGPRPEPDQKPDQPDATPRTEPDGGRTGSKRVPDKLPARRTERRLGGHYISRQPATWRLGRRGSIASDLSLALVYRRVHYTQNPPTSQNMKVYTGPPRASPLLRHGRRADVVRREGRELSLIHI